MRCLCDSAGTAHIREFDVGTNIHYTLKHASPRALQNTQDADIGIRSPRHEGSTCRRTYVPCLTANIPPDNDLRLGLTGPPSLSHGPCKQRVPSSPTLSFHTQTEIRFARILALPSPAAIEFLSTQTPETLCRPRSVRRVQT